MIKDHLRGKFHITTRYLYIAEYFVNHRVEKHPIYAPDIERAVVVMNDFYRYNGKGHAHKSLERNITGLTINEIYYPPEQSLESY